MNKLNLLLCAAWAMALILGGCAKHLQYEPIEEVCTTKAGKIQMMQTAQEVLSNMHFAIAKFDNRKGYIRTQPLRGAQFFERINNNLPIFGNGRTLIGS